MSQRYQENTRKHEAKRSESMKKLLSIVLIAIAMFSMSIYANANDTSEIMIEGMSEEHVNESAVKQEKPYIEMNYNLEIVTKEDWKNTGVGEYPIDVLSEKWNTLSYSEAAAACNMPIEYAKTLTTSELVSYALNYPFLLDIFGYDSVADGMNHLVNKSGVFKELFSRTDCYDKLLDEYSNLKVDYKKVAETYDMCATNYDAELFIEAYMGLNFDLLSREQINTFVEQYGNNFADRNSKCQDSVLSMIFYGAIKEKIGVVPENAVPKSVKTYLDPTELGGILDPIVAGVCEQCGASFLFKTIKVNGENVECYSWLSGGLTSADITYLDNYVASAHPTFTKLRSASSKYNCHSYAWYSTSTSNNYWIQDPEPIYGNTNYWELWNSAMRPIQSGDRITFWSGQNLLHSARVTSSTRCASKIGHWGVYNTSISEMVSYYGASTTKAYIP